MCDEPMQPGDDRLERRPLDAPASDPELERNVQAVMAKRKRDLADPEYNVLNAAAWHAHAGHLSNRITDLEAYFGPLSNLLESFKAVARVADNAVDLINILEKVEAYNRDAERYVRELRTLSNVMDGELTWYSDEIGQEWDHAEPEQNGHDAMSE